jgi:hypothetical protein
MWEQNLQSLVDGDKRIILREGLPTMDEVKDLASPDSELLLVLDDLIYDTINSKDMSKLFCTGRHLNLSIIFLTQNLYERGKFSRAINLNACYIILFRNIRDSNQIKYLGQQLFSDKWRSLVTIYDDVMKGEFQYLVIDLHPYSKNEYRLRTKIFPGEDMEIYQIK